MAYPSDHDGTVILGKRKKGKSTLTASFMNGQPRVIVYDAKGELTEPIRIYTGEYPDEQAPDYGLPARGVFRAYVPTGEDPYEDLEWAAHIAAKLGNCLLVVDEVADALSGNDPDKWFAWVIRMGRKRSVRYICTTQRPTEIPRMITANASDWYLFQTNEPLDLNYIRKAVGTEASRLVPTLKQGVALHCKDGVVTGYMSSRYTPVKEDNFPETQIETTPTTPPNTPPTIEKNWLRKLFG